MKGEGTERERRREGERKERERRGEGRGEWKEKDSGRRGSMLWSGVINQTISLLHN